MSKDFNNLYSLIAGMQRTDPRAYTAIKQMIDFLQDLDQQLNPLTRAGSNVVIASPVTAPAGFNYNFLPTGINFTWNLVSSAILYEIRVGGASWATANFVLRTSSLSAVVLPILIGTYTYRIKSINGAGTESINESFLSVVVIGPEGVLPSSRIIDNNVLLNWPTATSQFAVDYYELSRNGSIFGTIRGNFSAIFESVAGSYTYGITVVDIAGNRSPENVITATIAQPPDYVLDDSFISNLEGDRINCYVMPGW